MNILQDIALHCGGVDTCPFTGDFSVMTYNASELNTDVTRGLLLGATVKHGISVVGVQEPHGKLWEDYTSVHRTADVRSFHFMGNVNPGGRGASAIYWSNVWEHISSFSLMFVYLRHNFGSKVFFQVGHLHHLPTLHKEQWLMIKQIIKNFEGRLILLCDHNSVTISGVDSMRADITHTSAVVQSREAELGALASANLSDFWLTLFRIHDDLSFYPFGWTYGFGAIHRDQDTPNIKRQKTDTPQQSDEHTSTTPHILRRLDKVHVSDRDVGCIGGAFATFLAQSDHKAVIVTITAHVRSKRGHRHRVCPDLLSCDASTNALRRKLESIPKDADDLWDVSASLIREAAAHYSPVRTGNSKGVSQVVSVLHRSSVNRVCGEGWDLLRERGIEPPTHANAYKARSQIVDNLHHDFQGQTVLGKLQDLLTHDEEFDLTSSESVNQVYRLMKQLNNLRTVCAIRESERILTDPLDVAGKMKGSRDTVMVHGTSTVSEITTYPKSLPKFHRRAVRSGLLLRTYDYSLTITALNRLKTRPSLGEDGIPDIGRGVSTSNAHHCAVHI